MIGIGGVDDRVGGLRGRGQDIEIIEATRHRRDAVLFQTFGALGVAGKTVDPVASLHEFGRNRTTDIAGRAGHEDVHGLPLLFAGSQSRYWRFVRPGFG